MLEQVIQKYLIDQAKVDPSKFADPALMVADLGLDSLGLVEMLFEIEERFGFQLADPMKFQAMTFRDMVQALDAEIREHHGGELPDLDALSVPSNS